MGASRSVRSVGRQSQVRSESGAAASLEDRRPAAESHRRLAALVNDGPRQAAQRRRLRQALPSAGSKTIAQLVSYFHGGGQAYITNAINGRQAVRASQGELGSQGTYYWKDDENAALVSALVYNAKQPFAVMKVDIDPAVNTAAKGNISQLVFTGDSVCPYALDAGAGAARRIKGMHYRMIQNNMDTNLGLAPADNSIEGVLPLAYQNMTGRAFLDSFDMVRSPTKSANYGFAGLEQARGNDNALTHLIYGQGAGGQTNAFSQVWHGQINSDQRQSTVENMGLAQRDQVPARLLQWGVATQN